jgi:CheY-like chemotaxis protein
VSTALSRFSGSQRHCHSYFSNPDIGETPIVTTYSNKKSFKIKYMVDGMPVAISINASISRLCGMLGQLETMKKNILIVDQNQELLSKFSAAFLRSGYRVQIADRITDAVAMVKSGNRSAKPFDLVIVDISNERHLRFVADVQNINSHIPVFTLKDAADKSMVIDLLNQNQAEFIEHFIRAHTGA